jgi:hypothetical protein
MDVFWNIQTVQIFVQISGKAVLLLIRPCLKDTGFWDASLKLEQSVRYPTLDKSWAWFLPTWLFKKHPSWAPVAHTCKPSYSWSWNWEGHSSRPAQATSSWDPSQQKAGYNGICACHPSYSGSINTRGVPARAKSKTHLKNNQSKNGWTLGSSVECLPSECEALSSNSSTTKKKGGGWEEQSIHFDGFSLCLQGTS